MKNFSKLFAIALATVSLSASAATVLLTSDPLDAAGVDGGTGTNDKLSIVNVAKIKGVLEVRLSNDGLASDANEQRFAFGQAATDPSDAEDYEIDPNAAILQDHTCEGTGTAHVQKLWDDQITNPALAGSCVVGAGLDKQVDMIFKVGYKIDAAGGVEGDLSIYVDNGVDAALAAAPELAFLSASASDSATLLITAPISVGDVGGTADNGSPVLDSSNDEATGILSYSVSFDIAGAQSKPESRARFDHVLFVNL